LYTGCRLEELGQALLSDVREEAGIHFIDVTTLTDDDMVTKRVKTAASQRRVPLVLTIMLSHEY
jgi:integrase